MRRKSASTVTRRPIHHNSCFNSTAAQSLDLTPLRKEDPGSLRAALIRNRVVVSYFAKKLARCSERLPSQATPVRINENERCVLRRRTEPVDARIPKIRHVACVARQHNIAFVQGADDSTDRRPDRRRNGFVPPMHACMACLPVCTLVRRCSTGLVRCDSGRARA